MQNPRTNNTRSKDFRYVYANAFGLGFGNNEVQLIGGIQTNPGTPDPAMEEQVALIFTHTSAKQIAQMLNMLIADLEEANGQTIPIDQEKIKILEGLIAANKAARLVAKSKPA